jgi:hypothetical protein
MQISPDLFLVIAADTLDHHARHGSQRPPLMAAGHKAQRTTQLAP